MVDTRFYNKSGSYTIRELADFCGAQLGPKVDPDQVISDIASLHKAEVGHVSCFHNPKYLDQFKETKASACLVASSYASYAPENVAVLISEKPYRAYGQIAGLFYTPFKREPGISPQAVIHPTAKLGKNCFVGPFVIVEAHANIGNDCVIEAHTVIGHSVEMGDGCHVGSHVTITHTLMGKHVVIKSGARIGQKGFGFHMDEAGHLNIPQLGRVILEDEVEVGSNTTIDRGAESDTVIGYGSRIDNLVQIAHNVQMGENCVIVSQVGIAGSTQLGRYVVLAGQVGVAGHLTIGDGVRAAAQSGIIRDIEKGQTVGGYPAAPVRDWHRQTVALKKLIEKK